MVWCGVVCLVAGVLAALATIGAIVYGSVLNLQANFEKYEVRGIERENVSGAG